MKQTVRAEPDRNIFKATERMTIPANCKINLGDWKAGSSFSAKGAVLLSAWGIAPGIQSHINKR